MNEEIKSDRHYLFLLLTLLWVNVFTEVSLPVSKSFYIPSFFLILTGVSIWGLVKNNFLRRDYDFILICVLFFFISSVAAPNWDDVNSRLNGVLQMSMAVIMFCITTKFLDFFSSQEKEKFFIWVVRILFVLTFLEYIEVTKEISDFFREIAYTGQGYLAYDGDDRDLALGGAIRPKVFTAEPSLVAIGFLVAGVCAVYSNKRYAIALEVLALSVLEYLLLNSPIVLAIVVCLLPYLLIQRSGRIVGAIIMVLGFAMYPVYSSEISERLSRFSPDEIYSTGTSFDAANEKSERLRIIYPYTAAYDSISVNPISGLGISGKRSLAIYSSVSPIYEVAMGNNAFASIFVFFGLIGGGVFILIFLKYLSATCGIGAPLLLTIFIFLQTMGALESSRLWVYIGFIVGCFNCGVKVSSDSYAKN